MINNLIKYAKNDFKASKTGDIFVQIYLYQNKKILAKIKFLNIQVNLSNGKNLNIRYKYIRKKILKNKKQNHGKNISLKIYTTKVSL